MFCWQKSRTIFSSLGLPWFGSRFLLVFSPLKKPLCNMVLLFSLYWVNFSFFNLKGNVKKKAEANNLFPLSIASFLFLHSQKKRHRNFSNTFFLGKKDTVWQLCLIVLLNVCCFTRSNIENAKLSSSLVVKMFKRFVIVGTKDALVLFLSNFQLELFTLE